MSNLKTLILICLISFLTAENPLSHSFYEDLKSKADYEIYSPEEHPFRDYTQEELKSLVMNITLEDLQKSRDEYELEHKEEKVEKLTNLRLEVPKTYDFRKSYSNCVFPIRDQGGCGSCWAHGGVMAFQQRLCRKTAGKTKVVLSTQDPVSCEGSAKYCNGVTCNNLWKYLINKGTVSEACVPYVAGRGTVLKCPTKCTSGKTWKKYKATKMVQGSGADFIKNAVYSNGPIEVCFMVYNDFFSYKSGIYTHKSGGEGGWHAVSLIGWGVENGVKYWICMNSWGTSWGESGYFRIKEGQASIEVWDYEGYA